MRFRSTPEDLAWRARVERERLVGHPPDVGWLCAAHLAPARALADTATLAEAVARLRASEAPPALVREESRTLTIAPVPIDEFGRRLRGLVPAVAALLGVAPPELRERTVRHWHPMDGTAPPDCPFVDDTSWTDVDAPLALSGSRSWWAEGSLARAHESLLIRARGVSASVSGHLPADGSSGFVEEILVLGDLPAGLADALTGEFPAR